MVVLRGVGSERYMDKKSARIFTYRLGHDYKCVDLLSKKNYYTPCYVI